jgi:DNA-binding ferritin-like protein
MDPEFEHVYDYIDGIADVTAEHIDDLIERVEKLEKFIKENYEQR